MNATLQKSSRLCELNNFSHDKKPQYVHTRIVDRKNVMQLRDDNDLRYMQMQGVTGEGTALICLIKTHTHLTQWAKKI